MCRQMDTSKKTCPIYRYGGHKNVSVYTIFFQCEVIQLFTHKIPTLNESRKKKLENIVGKGDKRTMMVLYSSPEYYAVQVNNEDKYQIDY